MVYATARGLNWVHVKDFSSELVVPAREFDLQCVEVGRRSGRLYFLSKKHGEDMAQLKSIDLQSGEVAVLAKVPTGYRIESINADETLAAGVREERELNGASNGTKRFSKGEILYERVNEKIPMVLFTVDLSNGDLREVYRTTEWISHPQFSPTDPSTLMYSHEGPWHQVDRIWTIRTDGSERNLIHRRVRDMEIAGHEFWSNDGKRIHYDWQLPKGNSFYLASYDIGSHRRTAVRLDRTQWSIHYNSSHLPTVFVGDGANADQISKSGTSAAIFIYHVQAPNRGAAQQMMSEKLIDLGAHDYSLEPNSRLTPDGKWAIFRSNMFGSPGVYAVSVERDDSAKRPVRSTVEMARKIQSVRRGLLVGE
jgi:oligogalacturonide lyase